LRFFRRWPGELCAGIFWSGILILVSRSAPTGLVGDGFFDCVLAVSTHRRGIERYYRTNGRRAYLTLQRCLDLHDIDNTLLYRNLC